ncbi:MAG: 4Fe-4S binding protein [Phycisphaerae bacterium]|mgnify:CR=1 FL=1|nr:4Fe-4S binding protein [Phycisphaerae bacterium]
MAVRNIVSIDESKCDGCGLCVPNCAEGALAVVNGKARLVKESYCDGLGACLGECPRGAISIQRREADEFDEAAALAAKAAAEGQPASACAASDAPSPAAHPASPPSAPGGGCPGMRVMQFGAARGGPSAVPAAARFAAHGPRPAPHAGPSTGAADAGAAGPLGHWPVQLSLLPLEAPFLNDCELVLAADCTAFAAPHVIAGLLNGRAVAVGCPKLDDAAAHTEKLTEILRRNAVRGLVLVHMEVPCCGGIVAMAREAARRSGRTLPVRDLMIGCQGNVLSDRLEVVG